MQYNTFPYRSINPTVQAITEATARKWLRLDTGLTDVDFSRPDFSDNFNTGVTDDESETVNACIRSAVGVFERVTGLQIMQAEYLWLLSAQKVDDALVNPAFPVSISKGPNINNIEIKYKQLGDANYTVLTDSQFSFFRTGEYQNEIIYTGLEAVKPVLISVKFKAGYVTPAEIPADWLMPIRAIIADHFDNRADGLGDKMRLSERLMQNYIIPIIR